MSIVKKISDRLLLLLYKYRSSIDRAAVRKMHSQMGLLGEDANLRMPNALDAPQKIFMEENTCIHQGGTFLISTRKEGGNFVMKHNSGSAENLTVVTGNHQRNVNHFFMDKETHYLDDIDEDVTVHEEVWLGVNVTYL